MSLPVFTIYAVDPATGALTSLPRFTELTVAPERNGPGSISLKYPRGDQSGVDFINAMVAADRDLEVEIWRTGGPAGAWRGYLQTAGRNDVAESDEDYWTVDGSFAELRMKEAEVYPQPLVGETSLGDNVTVKKSTLTTAQWNRLTGPLGYVPSTDADPTVSVPQKVLDAVKANATSVPVLADPKRELQVSAATPGEVMHLLLAQARSRGALTDFTTSFTGERDSTGTVWPGRFSAKVSPGTTYQSFLNLMASLGRAEWSVSWNGTQHVLNLYVPQGRGVDRSLGADPVRLRPGGNIADAPRKWSVADSPTAMLGIGAEGFYADTSDLNAQTRRGRRIEASTSSQNLTTTDAVLAYAQRRLSTDKDGALEITHGLVLVDGEPMPAVDFDVCDWVLDASAGSGQYERHRVVEWSATVGSDADLLTATVTLNDALVDEIVRQRQRLDAMSSGETVLGTSVPGQENGEADTGVPAAPTGLVVGSAAFGDGGDTYAAVTAGWNPVQINTDGTAATDIDAYEVEWALASDPENPDQVRWQPGATVDGQRNQASWTLGPNLLIRVRVRARDRSGNRGPWSTIVDHLTEDDADPPGVASALTAQEFIGTIRWTWDGKTADGADMAAAFPDFKFCRLYMGTSAAFEDAAEVTQLSGAGTWTVADLTPGTTYYAWLVAEDTRGNAADPSASASETPRKIFTDDLLDDAVVRDKIADAAVATAQLDDDAVIRAKIADAAVGADEIAALAVGSAKIQDAAIVTAKIADLAVGGAKIANAAIGTAKIADAAIVTAKIGDAQILTAKLGDAVITTAKIQDLAVVDAKIGSLSVGKLTAGTMSADVVVAGIFRTALTGNRMEFDNAGLRGYGPSGDLRLRWQNSDASLLAIGEYRSASTGPHMRINPGGTSPDELRFYPSSTNQYARMRTVDSGDSNYPNQAGVQVDAYSARQDGFSGSLRLFPDYTSMEWGVTYVQCVPHQLGLRAPRVHFALPRNSGFGGGDDETMRIGVTTVSTGRFIDKTVISYNLNSADIPSWRNINQGSGLEFGPGFVGSIRGDSSGYNPIRASAFQTFTSLRSTKQDFEDLVDPLAQLRAAPVQRWRRIQEVERDGDAAEIHIGAMADDLPPEVVRGEDGTDVVGYAVESLVGLVHGGVNQLADVVDGLLRRVEVLEAV